MPEILNWTEPKQKEFKKYGKDTKNFPPKHRNDPCNHDGVITHLALDILECELKWPLGSGGDGNSSYATEKS